MSASVSGWVRGDSIAGRSLALFGRFAQDAEVALDAVLLPMPFRRTRQPGQGFYRLLQALAQGQTSVPNSWEFMRT